MPYVSVKEATNLTGKSEKTIRRLANTEASKPFITYEDSKLLIEISYLQQHYPLVNHAQPLNKPAGQSIDMTTQTSMDNQNPQSAVTLQHEIDLLKQELKHKEEIAREKDKRIEVLERSLLLLGEGVKNQPVPDLPAPVKKKRWWQW